MKLGLLWLLSCLAVAQGGARPLSDFRLTEPVLERYGFQDTASGLKDTVRNALYTGADREKVLAQIEAWQDEERRDADTRGAGDPSASGAALEAAADPAAQAAQGADGQAAVYDGQTHGVDAGEEVIAAWKARQKTPLAAPAPQKPQAASVPLPQVPTAAPLGLQGRGTIEKIIGLVMRSLPGPDLAETARRLAEETTGAKGSAASLPALCRASSQKCLNDLLGEYYGQKKGEVGKDTSALAGLWGHEGVYVRYGDGKTAPGEYLNADDRLEQMEAQQLIALGFRRELGVGEAASVRVIIAPGAGLSKNRGVWLSNPVLRQKDGSFDLVFSESVLAAASSPEVDLSGPLKAAPLAERDHILREILAGQDPISLGNRLNCLLLGWMQAATLRTVEQGVASGERAEQARQEAQDAVLSDPLKSRLYAIASNTQNQSRVSGSFDSTRMEGLEEANKDGTSDLWAMLSAANAGDPQAAAAFIAVLGKAKTGIARAEAADRRVKEMAALKARELQEAEQAPEAAQFQAARQDAAAATDAANQALRDLNMAVALKKSQAEIALLRATAAAAYERFKTTNAALVAADQSPQGRKIEALIDDLMKAEQGTERADQALVEARLAWERASSYLDYYEGQITDGTARDLDLSADFKAKRLRGLVLSGDKTAIVEFSSATVAAEAAAALLDEEAPKPPPRQLGAQDEEFLDAFLAAVYARPELRADYRDLVKAIAEAKGTRLYDAVLDRSNSFWPRFFSVVPADEAAELYDTAPETIRAKMRSVAASSSPPVRAFLAKVGAPPVSQQDRQEEMLLERASKFTGQFSVVDAAGQKVESRYDAYPMMIMEYLQEPDVLGPILEASRRTGMDPYLISAVAFQEGYNVFAEAVEKGQGTGQTYDFHSMVGPMGLDTFPATVDEMKRRGWIRPDMKECPPGVAQGCDYRILSKPAGIDIYGDARFLGPEPAETALEAMVGLIRKKRAQFLGDAGRLNIRAAGLSRQDIELWTYLYFNFTNPKELLTKYGPNWVWRPSKPGQDVYNVKRVGATAEWLRELRFFDGFWAPEKLGH